jgi:hypothetical protein
MMTVMQDEPINLEAPIGAINEHKLSTFIRAHLNCYHHEALTIETISKITEQIVDSFEHFVNNAGK